MEKTEEGRGDFADDVHPEKSIDYGSHQFQVQGQGVCFQNMLYGQFSSQKELQNQIVVGNGLFNQLNLNLLQGSQNMINCNPPSQRDQINNELHTEINFVGNQNMNNGPFYQTNSCYGYPYSIHHYFDDSMHNISIADERRNPEHFPHSQIFQFEMKPQKHIHSMTEKKYNQEMFKEKRRNIDQDALEQMDPDCMSECSPQLIPKFTYCVNMPQNFPKEQSYEALKRANEQKYLFLKSASEKLNQSQVTTYYKSFLETSYLLAKDKPEECAHLLLTLETQFDLILHVNKQVPKEYSKAIPKPNNNNSNHNDQDDDGGDAGDEGVV